MNEQSWAGLPNQTHPSTVLQMHINYIKAGADVITTNTYSSARHNLEPLGHGELTVELNMRAVHLAQEAIYRANVTGLSTLPGQCPTSACSSAPSTGYMRRPIAGRQSRSGLRGGYLRRGAITVEQSKDNLKEQSDILAEAGVDFMLAESTGSLEQRKGSPRQ